MQRVWTHARGTLGWLGLGVVLSAGAVGAQTVKNLAGTWTIVSNVNEQGGNKTDAFGPHPKGSLIVDPNGRYILVLSTATPEENKALVQGSITHFGTISVNAADKTMTFKVETAMFPNWDGTESSAPSPSPGMHCSILDAQVF